MPNRRLWQSPKSTKTSDQENSNSQEADVTAGDNSATTVNQLQGQVLRTIRTSNTQARRRASAEPIPMRCRLWSYGNIAAGGDGIDAESSAVAIAKVDQGVDQENSNSQECGRNDR